MRIWSAFVWPSPPTRPKRWIRSRLFAPRWKKGSRPTSRFSGAFRSARRGARLLPLLAAKRNDDFFIAAPEDYATILDCLDRNLIGLGADLQSKLLACLHCFSINDCE